MVKGVNKTIIEVMNTDNKYFERILFIVNSDALSLGDKKLQKEAQSVLKQYELTKGGKISLRQLNKQRRDTKRKIIIFSCVALIIAILVTVGTIL